MQYIRVYISSQVRVPALIICLIITTDYIAIATCGQCSGGGGGREGGGEKETARQADAQHHQI